MTKRCIRIIFVLAALTAFVIPGGCSKQGPTAETAEPSAQSAAGVEKTTAEAEPAGPLTQEVKVAVLLEPELPVYAGQLSLQPARVKPILEAAGIPSVNLSADEVADPAVFNADTFTVLVVPYGNSFPVNTAENMRAFRVRGGCLVTNGIPFCHPAEFVHGEWKDMGHVNYLHHDERGLGTGNFGNPAEGFHAFSVSENPLGITEALIPAKSRALQWLNPKSLPEEDEVIPIVRTQVGPEEYRPAAALVRHHCAMFKGACDVWMGQFGYNLEERDYFYLTQLLGRGVAWCLKEKGVIGEGAYTGLLRRMDGAEAPAPLPDGLEIVKTPRPWGETYLPKSNVPAETIEVVDARRLGREVRIALSCLQGLSSRTRPSIWIHFDNEDVFWLDWHVEKGHIKDTEAVADWKALFAEYKDAYRGAVVADTELYRGELPAVNVAACENLILCTPELAAELGLEVKADLRGKFATYHESMRWVWERYGNRLNHHLCDIIHPDWLETGAFAYDIQWRGIVFWIAGPKDGMLAGADPVKEMTVMSDIFSAMPPNVAMLGFPAGGEGVGLGEVGGTSFCGNYGKVLVCTDRLSNVPVTSGVRIEALTQPEKRPAPAVEKDKVYVALVYSDGDNQNIWRSFSKKFFTHETTGQYPVSYGMGPPIIDLQPAVAQWYYEKARPGTEFIADVSGIGYMRPEDFAIRFADREAVYEGFLDWTERYMKKMDMGTTRTVSGGDEFLERYISHLPFMHSLFADMGNPSGKGGYHNRTYRLGDMIVFRSLVGWGAGREGFLKDVTTNIGDVRPAFVNIMIHAWTFGDLEQLNEAVEQLPKDYVIVTPTQLADLYRQAEAKGWTVKE